MKIFDGSMLLSTFHVSLNYLLIDSCEDRRRQKWEPASDTRKSGRLIVKFWAIRKDLKQKQEQNVGVSPDAFCRYIDESDERMPQQKECREVLRLCDWPWFVSVGIFIMNMLSLGLLVSSGDWPWGNFGYGGGSYQSDQDFMPYIVYAAGKGSTTGSILQTYVWQKLWGHNMYSAWMTEGFTKNGLKAFSCYLSSQRKYPSGFLMSYTLM